MQARGEGSVGPSRVVRHRLGSRIYHWLMAVFVLTLLFTGFLPIVGVKFPWVTAHWIAGVVLSAALLYHILRATVWDGLGAMIAVRHDLRVTREALHRALRRTSTQPGKPGKYEPAQKLYHHAAAAMLLVTVVTGVLMMVRVDTSLWPRNPYWLADQTWGAIYVLHDLGAMALVTLVMVHIYFALRPEKRWLTRSMIYGWISVEEYRANFDPEAWPVAELGGTASVGEPEGR